MGLLFQGKPPTGLQVYFIWFCLFSLEQEVSEFIQVDVIKIATISAQWKSFSCNFSISATIFWKNGFVSKHVVSWEVSSLLITVKILHLTGLKINISP